MQPCPNCGQFAEAGVTHCANCGAAFSPKDTGRLITGSRGFDIVLGILLALVSICFAVGLILVPILYATQKDKRPSFALGLAIGGITVVVLILGAFLTCVGMIGWMAMHEGSMH